MACPGIWFLLSFSGLFGNGDCALEWFLACNAMAFLPERIVVHLYWMAPLPGVCKVNIDGSKINSSGLIGAGGLLRDSCGSWIKGFSVNLSYCSIIEAEL
ncbi:unnamed protein product [Prunus armeniaca]